MIKKNILLLSTLIILSACSFSDNEYNNQNPILEVNGFPVSQEAFEKMYIRHLIATGANDTRDERYKYLQKMTDKFVLGNEAIKKGILEDDRVKAKLELEKKKAYRDFFFLDSLQFVVLPVTEEEIKKAYERKQQKVYVRQLFFRDLDHANQYYERLENGEAFIALANELYKTASFDSTAGFIGEISYFSVEDTYAEVAFALGVGQYSKPFQNRLGIYIVKVEYKTRQPLLAESQLTLTKDGLRSQVKLRKQRIAGDRFIDSLMRTTQPKVNENALLQVHQYIRNLHNGKMIRLGESNKDKVRFTILDSDLLLDEYNEKIELMTYTLNGVERKITVSDFAAWMPELLPSELLNRPGASLGRVLRNEVMSELGKQNGFDTDKRVQYDLKLRTKLFAADLMMEDLIKSVRSDSSSIDEEAFNKFIKSRSTYQWNVKYFAKSFPSLKKAQEAKVRLNEHESDAVKNDGFSNLSETINPKHNKYTMLKDAPLGIWSVGADNDGVVYVYKVSNKQKIEETFEADDTYKLLFRSYKQIQQYSDSLNRLASIKLDTTQFENAMKF